MLIMYTEKGAATRQCSTAITSTTCTTSTGTPSTRATTTSTGTFEGAQRRRRGDGHRPVPSRGDTLSVPRVPDQVPCVRRGNQSGRRPWRPRVPKAEAGLILDAAPCNRAAVTHGQTAVYPELKTGGLPAVAPRRHRPVGTRRARRGWCRHRVEPAGTGTGTGERSSRPRTRTRPQPLNPHLSPSVGDSLGCYGT